MDAMMKHELEAKRKDRVFIPLEPKNFLPVVLTLKIVLHNYLLLNKLTYADVLRITKMTATQVNRIVSFLHPSKVDELERVIHLLGGKVESHFLIK